MTDVDVCKPVKWVQLSDLHFCDSTSQNLQAICLNKLKDVSFVIITGDLKQYNKDYNETIKFLQNISNSLKLKAGCMYFVPGNHDITEFPERSDYIKKIDEQIWANPDCYKDFREALTGAYIDYLKMSEKICGENFYKKDDLFFCLKQWENKLNILHINTSLLCNNKNNLQIVDTYGLTKLEPNGLPTLVIMHHDFYALHDAHQNALKRTMAKLNVCACLSGHAHKISSRTITLPNGNDIPNFVCGKTLNQPNDHYSDNYYIAYEWNQNNNSVWATPNKWEKHRFEPSYIFNTDDEAERQDKHGCSFYLPKKPLTNTNTSISSIYKSIFKYDAGTVQVYGRNKEKSILRAFLDVDAPFCWTAVTGVGGSGKTKLCYEFAEEVRQKPRWNVPQLWGSYKHEDLKREMEKIQKNEKQKHHLFVLDYVKWKTPEIGQWMKNLYDSYHNKTGIIIRVILIEREPQDIATAHWNPELRNSIYDIGNMPTERVENRFIRLEPLKDKALKRIVEDFAKKVYEKTYFAKDIYKKTVDETATTVIVEKLKEIDPKFCRPLYVLFLTDAYMRGEKMENWNRFHALEYVCKRERERFKALIQNGLVSESDFGSDEKKKTVTACHSILIMATLSGGLDIVKAKELAPDEWSWLEKIASRKLYYGNVLLDLLIQSGFIIRKSDSQEPDSEEWRIPPLEPDLVGEYYCIIWAQTLKKTGKIAQLVDVFVRALKNDIRAAALVRDRIIRDFGTDLQGKDLKKLFEFIELPKDVTSIGDMTFSDCRGLTKIDIPSSVTTIGEKAFYGCENLTEVNIPYGVTTIGEKAFYGCKSLAKIEIPDGVTTIGDWTFYGCEKLSEIDIGNVTTIGEKAFYGCKNLPEIKNLESVTTIKEGAFYGCESLAKIDIPSVTTIKEETFYGCKSLTMVKIHDGITSIENDAFMDCERLSEIIIPSSVTSIGDWVFSGCTRLTKVHILDSPIFNGKKMSSGRKSPTKVQNTDSIHSIGKKAFYECKNLTEIDIPDSVTSIGQEAFYECKNLTEIHIPDSVTSIGLETFYECTKLSKICIPDSITSIGKGAFYCCNNLSEICSTIRKDAPLVYKRSTKIRLPNGITSIGKKAFYGCGSLTEITVPYSVISIGERAFYECKSLSKVHIFERAQSIGEKAFWGCEQLKGISLPKNINIGEDTFPKDTKFFQCSTE